MSVCRVFERLDGSVLVVYPAPNSRRDGESEAVWLARVWARAVEADPALAGLPLIEIDSKDLPPRRVPCADGCGEEHSVRDLWRMSGAGKSRKPVHDQALRNPHAELSHLEQARKAELEKPEPDGGKLATIIAVHQQIAAHIRDEGGAPSKALVDSLTAAEAVKP